MKTRKDPINPTANLDDEALIRAYLEHGGQKGRRFLDQLFRRYYERVGHWCLAVCRDKDLAGDIAQDVFIQVQRQIGKFRFESSFSTWLYTVTRHTALNKIRSEQRYQRYAGDDGELERVSNPEPPVDEQLTREQVCRRLASAMEKDLKPIEARVVYLHYVDGLTLPAITELIGLQNRSGAKAHLVGGMRKLRRHFGHWLAQNQNVE